MGEYSLILVRCKPTIIDAREMITIVTCSLRSLWGDLEPHSCELSAEEQQQSSTNKGDNNTSSGEDDDGSSLLMTLRCRSESVSAIRASLTMFTLPHYLEGTLYQFDVVDINAIP